MADASIVDDQEIAHRWGVVHAVPAPPGLRFGDRLGAGSRVFTVTAVGVLFGGTAVVEFRDEDLVYRLLTETTFRDWWTLTTPAYWIEEEQ